MHRPAEGIAAAETRVANNPNFIRRHYLGLALAADAGQYERSRALLEQSWQESGNLVTSAFFTVDAAMALIAIRSNAGEMAGVGELHAAIQDNVRRYHEAGMTRGSMFWSVDYEEGITAFLAGDRVKGLALIGKGAEDGYFIRPGAAYLQALYDDPGFTPILAKQEARQARERDRFLRVICRDNPYQDVWQPAEGTCERFAAVALTDSR